MKITVTRTFEPITKIVEDCHDCPYYERLNDGNCTLPMCNHPKFGVGGYDNVIPDIDNGWHSSIPPKISKNCPYRKFPETIVLAN